MPLQQSEVYVKGSTGTLSVTMKDGGIPVSGLAFSDIRVLVLKQDAPAIEPLTVTAVSWKESEPTLGKYVLQLAETELDTEGTLLFLIEAAPGYVGTLDDSVYLCYVAISSEAGHGLIQSRDSWVPIYLENAGSPVGGISAASTAKLRKDPVETWDVLTINGTTFREITYLAVATGIYQIKPGDALLDTPGTVTLWLDDAGFTAFVHEYRVVTPVDRRINIDLLMDQTPVEGATVTAVIKGTQEISDEGITDAAGQTNLDLPDGEYFLVVEKSGRHFTYNNHTLEVTDPNVAVLPPEAARLIAGNPGPYTLIVGDDLQITVSGGEDQVQEVLAADIPASYSISSLSAETLAAIYNLKFHSLRASAGGWNDRHLVLTGLLGAKANTLQVRGGSANVSLNFSLIEVPGKDSRKPPYRLTLDGTNYAYTPAADPANTVAVSFSVVDMSDVATESMEVRFVNKFNPAVRSSSVKAVLGNPNRIGYTNSKGVLTDKKGKPIRLVIGTVFDVVFGGTGISRHNLVVPGSDFNLADLVSGAADIFTMYRTTLPELPRT